MQKIKIIILIYWMFYFIKLKFNFLILQIYIIRLLEVFIVIKIQIYFETKIEHIIFIITLVTFYLRNLIETKILFDKCLYFSVSDILIFLKIF